MPYPSLYMGKAGAVPGRRSHLILNPFKKSRRTPAAREPRAAGVVSPALHNRQEGHDTMKAIAIALAVGALALSAASLPPVALAADAHDHGAATSAKLHLDHGRKWATDEPLRRGMAAIREGVHGAPAPMHKATARPEAYAELGGRIEAEVGRIVKECKLPPDADAQLHLVIADVIAGADAMKSAKTAAAGRAGLVKVDGALKTYAKYFDHPGWATK